MAKFTQKHPVKAKAIIFLLSFFISCLLAELMVRGFEYYQYVKLSDRIQYEQYKKIYSDERDKDYMFGHKRNVNVKLKRGAYSFTFITNSEGLREAKDHESLEKSVIFLGDSIVEGASVENHEAMDEIFEKYAGIAALNFGVGSSNTVQEFYWLRSKYKDSYNAKLIILGFCLNDFPQNTYLRYFDPSVGNWSLYKYLDNNVHGGENNKAENRGTLWQRVKNIIKQSRLVAFIYNSTRNIKTRKDSPLPFRYDQVSEEEKYYTELYINKILEFSKRIGSEFVVVIFPQESQLRHQYDPHERMQDALIDILDKNKIKYIDLYDLIKVNYLAEPDIRWFHDDTHPYKEGHRLIGEYLARELPKMFPNVFE